MDSPQKIIRRPAVKAKTGIPNSTMALKIMKGEFPRPVPLGARSVGWVESEIDEWIAARIDARSKGTR
jgi:prophage regulatory protein